ncbi:DUF779 domain-containing protein [Celeribacter sp. HF31]|uniref:DUF779 domain-containing protein n=1 Tax=Celeribacter sp. HF31 TaxID=2721558 RepID=UPI00142F5E94|nr:DUF779 domain-containing protein [Celeribacter sp. HF31]NIY80866.1 DUF779 domain-containing protein [Celeribacter sp. HF31]
MPLDRVTITDAARSLLDEIVADHGPVMFVQSGGCCDGSSPMCYKDGDYLIGSRDIKLGEVAGAPVWISESLFEIWRHSQMILDAGPGHGAGFSLDTGRGTCFLSRSRVFTDEEWAEIEAAEA